MLHTRNKTLSYNDFTKTQPSRVTYLIMKVLFDRFIFNLFMITVWNHQRAKIYLEWPSLWTNRYN